MKRVSPPPLVWIVFMFSVIEFRLEMFPSLPKIYAAEPSRVQNKFSFDLCNEKSIVTILLYFE